MKRKMLMGCALLVFPLIVWSCGGGGGGEISDSGVCGGGTTDSGLCVTLDSITPTYNGGNTADVDVFQNSDCDGDLVADDPEYYAHHGANVTITVTLLDSYADNPAAGDLITFTSYTIDYSLTNGPYASSPPAIPSKTFLINFSILKNATASNDAPPWLLDLDQKLAIAAVWTPAGDVPSYAATYTFYGEDDKGNDIEVTGHTSFFISDFNNCP